MSQDAVADYRSKVEEHFRRLSTDSSFFSESALHIMNDVELTRTRLHFSDSQQLLSDVVRQIEAVHRQPVRIDALKSRQVYYSTATAALSFQRLYFAGNDARHTTISYDWPSTKVLMEMVWGFAKHMPDEYRRSYTMHRNAPYAFHFRDTGAFMDSLSGETSDPGRGGNRYFLHASELAMFRDPLNLMNALMPSVPDRLGTVIIRETTARGYDAFFRPKYLEDRERAMEYCHKYGAQDPLDLLFNRTGWGGKKHPNGFWPGGFFPLFVPWTMMQKYIRDPKLEELTVSRLTKLERTLADRGLTMEQLAWRRYCIREKLGGPRQYHDESSAVMEFQQEYPMTEDEAFKSSGRPFLDRVVVTQGLNYSLALAQETWKGPDGAEHPMHQPVTMRWAPGKEPQWDSLHNCLNPQKIAPRVVRTGASDLIVYKTPFRDPKWGNQRTWVNRYVIGADIAEGKAQGDYSVAYVLDRVAWETVAEYRGHPAPLEFAEILVQLARYYDDAWINGEYNDQGPSVVPRIRDMYLNVCRRHEMSSGVTDEEKDAFWFLTAPKSKNFMASVLKEAVESAYKIMPFPGWWEEAQSFVADEHGRLGAEGKRKNPGVRNYDDRIMAFGMALVGHLVSPAPFEGITPQGSSEMVKRFERAHPRKTNVLDTIPKGVRKSMVL